MLARWFSLILLVFSSGCISQNITDLSPYLTSEQLKEIGSPSLEAFKKYYFTAEAYAAIKDIPLIEGPATTGYAAGTTFLSDLASLLTFNGLGRKIILNRSYIRPETLLHEYIHHLDDLTRKEEANFISLEEFREGYKLCFRHLKYHGLTIYTEQVANGWFTNWFGIGEFSEHLAYVGARIAFQDCPPKLGWAYRKILKKYQDFKP